MERMVTEGKRLIGVDLFAGAGGLSLGFEQAGFDVAAAVEIDPIHACVHKYNFPNCTVIPRSVKDVTGDYIRSKSNLIGKKINVVFGGAPCQGFSLIGKRALDDPRNALVREFVRILSELDADYFLFENVKGLTIGKHKAFLDELIGAFDEIGYEITAPWEVLNAANYGVPQNRERLFLMGCKRGLVKPLYPLPITRKSTEIDSNLAITPSCHEALGDIPNAEDYQVLKKCDEVAVDHWTAMSSYAKQLRCISEGSWHYGYKRKWDKLLLTSSMRSNHTQTSRQRFEETIPGNVEPISRFFKLAPNGLCNTLRAGTDSSRGAFTSPRPIHYKYARCITVREMARLHGFPDWFRFHETKWHGARQIGNAVPPPLAKAVASAIQTACGGGPIFPKQVLDLADSELLRLDMTNASKYWGIEVPIEKRDRKNASSDEAVSTAKKKTRAA